MNLSKDQRITEVGNGIVSVPSAELPPGEVGLKSGDQLQMVSLNGCKRKLTSVHFSESKTKMVAH